MLNAKAIRQKVADELISRSGAKWFDPESRKLKVASADNLTDFIIEIDLFTDRRHGVYVCEPVVVLKWKSFSTLHNKMRQCYDGRKTYYNTKHHEFLRSDFEGIFGVFKKTIRDPILIESEEDIDRVITQCADDLDGKVGQWIKRWFTWVSALEVMDDNHQLCGAWRDTAYYCLMRQVHGYEPACAWVHSLDRENWPDFFESQARYLRTQVCEAVAISP